MIRVPVDVYSLTLVINNVRVAPIWTENIFANVFNAARQIWLPAQVDFTRRSFNPNAEIELANANSTSRVNPSDREYILAHFRGANGVSVVLVNQASSQDPAAAGVGGGAARIYQSCLLAHSPNTTSAGIYLAHEFGHLLGLHDIYTGLGDNLMYGAVGTGAAALDGGQHRAAWRGARLLIQSPNQPTR
jgi:hypothetical protein